MSYHHSQCLLKLDIIGNAKSSVSTHSHKCFWPYWYLITFFSNFFFFFFFTINRFFLDLLFSCETNCHADLDDSKAVRATSVGPPGESPYVYVLDVHANTAPRELEAMLRRYVDDWLRLSPRPPPTVSQERSFSPIGRRLIPPTTQSVVRSTRRWSQSPLHKSMWLYSLWYLYTKADTSYSYILYLHKCRWQHFLTCRFCASALSTPVMNGTVP